MNGPGLVPVLSIGRDEAGNRDHAHIGEELGHLADAANILFPVLGAKSQVLVQGMAHIVTV